MSSIATSKLPACCSTASAAKHVISYPLAWVSPQWPEVDLSDGTSGTSTVAEDTLAKHRLSVELPLRRWGARRALRADPTRLDDLLRGAEAFEPRHRDALIHPWVARRGRCA
jgi:hypothetical protein